MTKSDKVVQREEWLEMTDDRRETILEECLESLKKRTTSFDEQLIREVLQRAYEIGFSDGWNACGKKYFTKKH